MIDTPTSVIPVSPVKAAALRRLSCLRPQDVVVLQGPPLLGALFAIRELDGHHLWSLALLGLANVLLVTHIFMLNDWSGVATDVADPNKVGRVFITRGVTPHEVGILTVVLLTASLLLFWRLGPLALCLASAIAGLSALYSLPRFNWKGRPVLNSLTHLVGGVLHFLLGYTVGHAIDGPGVALGAFVALIFVGGHLTQEIRDHQGDAIAGIRTNAVRFGPRRTFAAGVALFGAAHALLLVLVLQGILPRMLAVVAAFYLVQVYWSRKSLREGLTYAAVSRLQARYRALYAVIGLVMSAALLAGSR